MNSVERVHHYGNIIPVEAPLEIPETCPRSEWPLEGTLVFQNVEMSYLPELPLVLRDISFSFKDKEKIGIVGRTGSGKSSIIQASFRFVEVSGGKIFIDGIDIATIGLRSLRQKIGIIPQDPILFSGTFRRNLDPFSNYSDLELWSALERAQLKKKITHLGGLDGAITEGGSNLSVGQRQLLCLARALVEKSKILFLDECTANVDYESDAAIQKCIREDLKDCTVITIAHRLNTILDYDRIIVLDHGKILEFDSPSNLLGKKGVFYDMVEASKNE